MKKPRKHPNRYPRGWNALKVRRIIDYYENQTDEEAAAEDEAALSARGVTLMRVPVRLVPAVRRLIASHRRRGRPKS